ncbi:class IV lanthionine synthetase LanL [Actinomadura sp. 9N215]|uniref:class IV lanthionine synthetase LanL n=1 Tax=Actinomadura sp. 9N215 TaxID=3375150 RepID=UPI0037A4729D
MADFSISVFGGAVAAESGDTRLTDVLDRALASADDRNRWTTDRGAVWCHVKRDAGGLPPQGWKLHVSATPASAEEVLARSLAVLLAAGSPFKFAATHDRLAALNARNTSRGHSGKFITIYPTGDDEAVRLAAELDKATTGLPGPRILSDRPYAPGSLVHYRYGAFVEERRITNDGFYAWMILDPDGNPVEDKRVGRYTPPPWVTCPFPDHGTAGGAAGRRDANGGGGPRNEVLIGTRFTVREAIRHTNKGGVYRALDTRTNRPVVIKEARPHVAADETGRDARDRLRAEARALATIESLGVAPRPVRLFTQGGHLFLAEEMIPGTPLRNWTADLIGELGWGPHLPAALEMAGRLTDLMIKTHDVGVVLRDFNPNNIMVRPDGEPVLIDLELAAVPGSDDEPPLRIGTPGYAAPEQMDGAAPDPSADRYALGATLCHVISGGPPYLLDERPASRPHTERLAEWLTARIRDLDPPAALPALLLGLMADDPADRWAPEPARAALSRLASGGPGAPDDASSTAGTAAGTASAGAVAGRPASGREEPQELSRLAVTGIVGHLLATMGTEDAETLWPASCVHGAPDPCCLQQGAAGVLGALVRCYELTADPRLPEAIGRAGRWISARLDGDTQRPAGLYYGTAGAVWAILDAGLALDDDGLVAAALAAADRLPAALPGPDVTHGTAGLGLTALHLWARTGLSRYAERAAEAADALAGTVEERSGGLIWSTPAHHESKLAGKRYYGFAHGVAGIGHFLAACARATGRDEYRALAVAVGDDLLREATVTGRAASWGAGPGDEPTAPYWCHGAAGIGGFLLRLGAVTGDERFVRAAERAARSVLENRWRAPLGQCHGLAGNGDFLLDMAAATGDDRYRDAAWRLTELILSARAHRDGAVVFPDEFGQVSVTWGDGMSGILGFLLRVRHGASRQWTADPPDAHASGPAAAPIGSGRTS